MRVRLLDIAHARSGDKGDTANVGVIALEPRWYEVLKQFVTRDKVADHFEGLIKGEVERYGSRSQCAHYSSRALDGEELVAEDRRAGSLLYGTR